MTNQNWPPNEVMLGGSGRWRRQPRDGGSRRVRQSRVRPRACDDAQGAGNECQGGAAELFGGPVPQEMMSRCTSKRSTLLHGVDMFAVDRHPLRVGGDRGAHAWRRRGDSLFSFHYNSQNSFIEALVSLHTFTQQYYHMLASARQHPAAATDDFG